VPHAFEPIWNDALAARSRRYVERYFGNAQGLTSAFPCMRDHYPWRDDRPDVPDSRIPAKNNTEYHGLERLAKQYQAAAMYDLAAHHWLLACWWRRVDRDAHGFSDPKHEDAIAFCHRMSAFTEALHAWSAGGGHDALPDPRDWGLDPDRVDALEREGEERLIAAHSLF
jgi:hypothetical protein